MGGKVSLPTVQLSRDRIFVVTGANTGIGYETAKWIAMMGGTVVLACRSEEKTLEAIKRMNEEYKEEKEKGTEGLADLEKLNLEYMHLDLSSFQSTKDFAEAFKRSGRQLHVLVCNAGIISGTFVKTDDGFESSLQVNYLSHFLLIGKLLPDMKKNGDDVRIVLVSAGLHKWPIIKYDINQMNYSGDANKYSAINCYGTSKLYQIMQMHCMKRRLKNTNICVTSLHPGVIQTGLARDMQWSWIRRTLQSFAAFTGYIVSTFEGAKCTIYAAVSPEMKGVTGIYLEQCKESSISSTARDETKQEEVWKKTMEYLKDHFTEGEIQCMEGTDPAVS